MAFGGAPARIGAKTFGQHVFARPPMTQKEQDTDPAAPASLRASTGPLGQTARMQTAGSAAKPSTDPGMGPSTPGQAFTAPLPLPGGAPAPPVAHAALGLNVPIPGQGYAPTPTPAPGIPVSAMVSPSAPAVAPSSTVPAKKDSVELLLEGMAGPSLDRTKTTPQTDGQAAAAYHAQHGVRPARTSPDSEPKVVVEKMPLNATMRVDRSRIHEIPGVPGATPRALEPTAVTPPSMAPRIAVAIFSALAVVIAMFAVIFVARRSGASGAATRPAATVSLSGAASAPAVPTAPTATQVQGPGPTPVETMTALPAETATQPEPPAVTAPQATSAARPAPRPPSAPPLGPRPGGTGRKPPSAAKDLQTTFD
jgi:Meckel syndrome type 1 protein